MSTTTPRLELPEGKKNLLLHSCCAPCAVDLMERMLDSGINFTIYFYNPNIHPKQEYELRKNENKRFAEEHGIPFIDGDYDRTLWFERVKGFEDEPERGHRCTLCFDMRFEQTAAYAHAHGFDTITSSLGISRWKNMDQINRAGIRSAARYPGLNYWTYNWRKHGGSQRMISLSKENEFYQQQYCGCVYSLRDTNRWRRQTGRDRIKLGSNYYHHKETELNKPESEESTQV